MTEKEFWSFLEGLWEKGRAAQFIGSVDTELVDPALTNYLSGHKLLPKDCRLSQETIVKLGNLLFDKNISLKTKEAIIILLAHQPSEIALTILAKYNLAPDAGLKFFAELALEECAMWNE